MPVVGATLTDAIREAVGAIVLEPDAPTSAWPERFPGRWATTARISELIGRRTGEVSYRLHHELVESGEVVAALPWPGTTRGYQPAFGLPDRTPLIVLPDVIENETQWILDELKHWALLHGGLAPRQRDWSKERDPEGRWPRAQRVVEVFLAEACEAGLRYWVDERCAPNCCPPSERHYANSDGEVFCDGCFECKGGRCPHGDVGHWVGPSGWRYALQLAGLDVRTGL